MFEDEIIAKTDDPEMELHTETLKGIVSSFSQTCRFVFKSDFKIFQKYLSSLEERENEDFQKLNRLIANVDFEKKSKLKEKYLDFFKRNDVKEIMEIFDYSSYFIRFSSFSEFEIKIVTKFIKDFFK